jgi:hypothetical protein
VNNFHVKVRSDAIRTKKEVRFRGGPTCETPVGGAGETFLTKEFKKYAKEKF